MQHSINRLEQLDSDILAITPIEQHSERLLILTQTGFLYDYQADIKKLKVLYQINLPPLPNDDESRYKSAQYALHSSPNGQYIAIVVNYGQFGVVIKTQTGEILLNLDAKNYHNNTVPFSLAFTSFNYDDIVIYRSDWNKLNAYNLSLNKNLTERHIAKYEHEQCPEHYLNYFHGALYISPNAEYILDDGWVWHPVSIPRYWSLPTWLNTNVFESEDGESLKKLCQRENWDYPMCWLDNKTIALWHIEIWDEEEFDLKPDENNGLGLHLFSLIEPQCNDIWQMPEQSQNISNLYVDQQQLILIGDENITIYNHHTREICVQIPNQRPHKHHLQRKSLWSFVQKTLHELCYASIK